MLDIFVFAIFRWSLLFSASEETSLSLFQKKILLCNLSICFDEKKWLASASSFSFLLLFLLICDCDLLIVFCGGHCFFAESAIFLKRRHLFFSRRHLKNYLYKYLVHLKHVLKLPILSIFVFLLSCYCKIIYHYTYNRTT